MMGRIEGCVGVLRDCLPKLGDGVSVCVCVRILV